MNNKEEIKRIIFEGTQQEKLALFTFNNNMPVEKVLFKFNLFINSYFIRYLKNKSAPFHDEMIKGYIESYRGENFINLAFRGSAKSSYLKLFLVYVILNDEDHYRKYLKILSRDLKNPKQIVTDVYNMCLEMRWLYGDVFEKEGDKKREETMGSFTLKTGVKLTAGTVGQAQRGHLQDAFRPDWIIFDDIEDSETVTSQVITEGIISSCDEAITGLQPIIGSWCVLGNYLSEDGVIQWFINKSSRKLKITPILQDNKPTWDIYTMAHIEQLKKDSESFETEYMCDPSRGDNKFFDIDRINEDLKKVRQPYLVKDGIKFYSPFIQHMRYGIGADTSEGIGKDSNALTMWNYRTGEQVASYHSNEIKPELFAYYIAKIGKEYGECLVAPEINNMSGGIVITTLKNQYPESKIFRHTDPRNSMERESQKLGWYTTSLTKTNAFMDFRKDYNDGIIKIYDADLLKEMKMFNTVDLQEKGTGITRHFDLLMACFVENTLILTDKGQTPIQYIKPGDMVMTRKGLRKVLKTANHPKPVINNIGLRGTEDHPVILQSGGVKPLLQVDGSCDKLIIWNQQKKDIENMSYIEARNIIDIQTQQKGTTECTTWVGQNGRHLANTCIEKCGKMSMEKFLRGMSCTIKMVIHQITSLATLNFLQRKNIKESIWQIQTEESLQEIRLTKKKTEKKQNLPTWLQSVIQGIKRNRFVRLVQKNLCTQVTMPNSAQKNASGLIRIVKSVYTKKLDLVGRVANYLRQLSLGRKAVQRYVHKEEIEQVYSLEVEECPEYFANSILVHNCIIGWSAKSHLHNLESKIARVTYTHL